MFNYLIAEDTKKYQRKQAFMNCFKSANINGVANTISTRQGRGCCDNYILIKNKTKQGYLVAEPGDGINISTRMHYQRGTVQKGMTQTITCTGGNNVGVVFEEVKNHRLWIRKLTPLECFRLMGFDDKDCAILKDSGISECQLYKMAGNSIVVNVAQAILKQLIKEQIL